MARFHAGYLSKLVGNMQIIGSKIDSHLFSFPVADIKRTLDAMSMVKVIQFRAINILLLVAQNCV